MPMDDAAQIDESTVIAWEDRAPVTAAPADDLSWAVVKLRAGDPSGGRIVINEAL
ncbi:MAG: hypothetical protein JF564_05445, partial [Sphingomonas sp.]|nr:hypothetical protein [Sphingomonas sp.]